MAKEDLIGALREKFASVIEAYAETYGDETILVRPEGLVPLMTGLKSAPFQYEVLLDLTCVDFLADERRLEMVYHLYSLSRNKRLRIKVSLPEEHPSVDSLSGLWKNANWLEREVFDMFGVAFTGHPDLRRILMYDGFEGHPLRKSYPWRKEQPRIPLRD